ncbi:MAG: PIG-L family deacetylase [Anaerolineae bacterium]|nr:PIG-L family deacetylase [Anaerolineae bacterium]
MSKRAFAVAAHPDDIEFLMAGTLILLQHAGYEIHTMTVANGSCGTAHHTVEEIVDIRRAESRAAAALIGAIHHDSLVDDIAIFYEPALLARVAAVMRDVAPDILLTHSPVGYMEDHQNTARLAVTAAFCRGMPNFPTDPPRAPVDKAVTVYHAQPHGNRDPLRRLVRPEIFIDVTSVIEEKRAMLACHHSQKTWLDQTQGMDAYLNVMQDLCHEVGQMSGRFKYAEGWRRRLHLGFCDASADPLLVALWAYVETDEALS